MRLCVRDCGGQVRACSSLVHHMFFLAGDEASHGSNRDHGQLIPRARGSANKHTLKEPQTPTYLYRVDLGL